MDIATLTQFFLWCTIINGGLLTLWALIYLAAPNLVYRTQSKWFPMPRETFNIIYYGFIGLFKIGFILFNVVPYVALRLIG